MNILKMHIYAYLVLHIYAYLCIWYICMYVNSIFLHLSGNLSLLCTDVLHICAYFCRFGTHIAVYFVHILGLFSLIMQIYCIFLTCIFVQISCIFGTAYFVHISAYFNLHIMVYLPLCIFKLILVYLH